MVRNWRAWVLLLLLVGPVLAYVGLGALWLTEHRGPLGLRGELLYYAMTVWVASGVLFAVLANRWTKSRQTVLPPIDWDAPQTFTPLDRQAWDLVQQEAARGDEVAVEMLTSFDTYMNSGRDLARRLAAHYRPHAADPLEHVPVVDLLTAFQLAAEDLAQITRQVPGGDLITPSHWKKAVAAVGLVQRANEFYTLLLPVFQPVVGLARLGAQKLMVQPAWRNAQANLMRWFFRAYVNRLGTHLIELFSGRLAIGADAYRRLTRKTGFQGVMDDEREPWAIAVAGADGAGKSTLIKALDRARTTHLERVRAELIAAAHDVTLADRLQSAALVEVSVPRDAAKQGDAVAKAVETDLLLLAVDIAQENTKPAARFLEAVQTWFAAHPGRDVPPLLVVGTHADRPELGEPWHPPYDWLRGRLLRELTVRAVLDRLRNELPASVAGVVAVGLPEAEAAFGVVETLLPALAGQLPRTERSAILRQLSRLGTRSKARRVLGQVGRQGRRLWSNLTSMRGRRTSTAASR